MAALEADRLDAAVAQLGGELTNEELRADLVKQGWTVELPLHLESVALASACARARPRACAQLEHLLVTQVPGSIGRVSAASDFKEEVLQRVRAKLLSGDSPKIATYAGRGPLVGWLRVVARREALALQLGSKGDRERPVDWIERLQGVDSRPENAALQARYAEVFRRALAEVLQSLDIQSRNLLRLQLVEGASPAQIAKTFNLSVSAVYRRLEKAHSSILSEVRQTLRRDLGPVSRSEMQSLFHMVEGQLDVSLSRLLAGAGVGSSVDKESREPGLSKG